MAMEIIHNTVHIDRTEKHYSASDALAGRDFFAVEAEGQTTLRYMSGEKIEFPTEILDDLIDLIIAIKVGAGMPVDDETQPVDPEDVP